jgi:hypothetical protein
MTRRLLCSVAAALALAACTDAPTNTTETPGPDFITGNFTADNTHTWVGLIVFYDADGNFSHRCSGSLLEDRKTFLTAGHCTDNAATVNVVGDVMPSARVWFAQDAGARFTLENMEDPVSGYPNTCLAGQAAPCVTSDEMYNYGFNNFAGFPDTQDAGVVILDAAVTTVGFGRLASFLPAPTLDALVNQRGQQDVTFVSSGYGLNQVKPFTLSFRSRMMAASKLVNLTSSLNGGYNVQTSANPGGGRGGTCFGDSGGPLLYQGEIVGVTSFGLNFNCKGVDFAYRVDRAEVQSWIATPD